MLKKIVLLFAALALAKAQIPNFGFCPEYLPMASFDQMKFLGIWHEAERYFQLSEVVSRCVTANYTFGHDQKLRVSNEVTNRFTGIKRILEGEIKPPASKSEVGILRVKYNTVPLTPETQYSVLETDYDNYAVLWSCSGFGPIHTQSAWLMTRDRYPSTEILQQAYGVLDKYHIDKRFIVKTDQKDCDPGEILRPGLELVKPQAAPAAPAVAAAPAEVPVKTALRSASVLEAEAADVEVHEHEVEVPVAAEEPLPVVRVASLEKAESDVVAEKKPEVAVEEAKPEEVVPKVTAPETVPEMILKVAEAAKKDEAPQPEIEINAVAEESKNSEIVVPVPVAPETEAQPISVAEFAAKTSQVPEPAIAAAEPELPAVEHKAVEESKPVEAAVKLAAVPEPVEIVAVPESVEEAKPLEAVPAVKSPEVAETQAAPELPEKIETPAAVEPLPESSPALAPEAPVEPPAVLAAEPEKFVDVSDLAKLPKPAVEQPLKSVEVAAEEPKLEPIAEVEH